jgi:hypothetical protein
MQQLMLFVSLLLTLGVASYASDPAPLELGKLETAVANQYNDLRIKAGLKPLKVRDDIRVRMEACAVEVHGPDPMVQWVNASRKNWYMAADPLQPSDELSLLANEKTGYDHISVGVWFAKTDKYPSGMYWIVVWPEYGAAHEAFWSHWYLTDTFEYQTGFDKHWRSHLPVQCASIK